jgi:O-methyltransferase
MVEEFLRKYPISSDQIEARELRVILHELQRVVEQGVAGDVVEFGCFEGTTSLFMQRLLVARKSPKQLHVYDSFAGLPDKGQEDQSPTGSQFRAGELRAAKPVFIKNFRQAGLPLPAIHKGWFNQLGAHKVPGTIAFAFLDGDFYSSILDSFRLITPKLAPQAVIVVDDYQSEALPGAAKAVDEWLAAHPQARLRVEASLAVIYTTPRPMDTGRK